MKKLVFLCLLVACNAWGSRSGGGVVIDGVDLYCQAFSASISSGNSVYTCVPASTAPGAPTSCLATINSVSNVTLSSAGGAVSLAVVCAQTSGVTYNWKRNSTTGVSTARTWTDTLPSNSGGTNTTYSYNVSACINSACVTVPASPLVATVTASGSFSGSCPGFDNTIILTANWASPTRLYTGHMGANDIAIVQFTTGSGSSSSSLPFIAGAEYNSPPSSRLGTLSASPCDFTTQTAAGANIGPSTSITARFAVGSGTGYGYYPVLNTSTTYYLNVKNVANSTCASSGECGMFFDLVKNGTP